MSNTNKFAQYDISKILIIQFKPWGDVLLCTTYFSTLKKKFSTSQIDFLVSEPFNNVLKKNPFLNDVIALPRNKGWKSLFSRLKMILRIRKKKYDIIIDQQNANLSVQTLLFSGARFKLGWENGKGKFLYNIKAKRGLECYSGAAKFDIIKPLGIDAEKVNLFYHIEKKSINYINSWLEKTNVKNKIICFSPGSPVKEKMWKSEFYSKVADKILENTPYSVIFLWAPNELGDVKYIMANMRNTAVLAPPTNFNQCAAFLKKTHLLICNDGGLNHLSVATNTPSLAIFGRTSPLVWSPQGYAPNHYHINNPDYKYNGDQRFGVSPDSVYAKIIDILNNYEK